MVLATKKDGGVFDKKLSETKNHLDLRTFILRHLLMLELYLKTKMSPENCWLEDVFPIEIVPF